MLACMWAHMINKSSEIEWKEVPNTGHTYTYAELDSM